MAERFQRLFTLPSRLYKEGCPVAIIAGALQKDTVTNKILAQIKMLNIGNDNIKSCKVKVTAYDNYGNQVEEVTDFSYLDLDVKPGEEFGSKTPVFLPFDNTRSFSVEVVETVLKNDSIKQFDQSGWKQIPEPKRIEEYLKDSELIKQFKIETGEESNFLPENSNGLFLCSCGGVNLDTNSKCNNCGKTYESLIKVLDDAELKEKTRRRIAVEQIQQAEEEKQKKKKTRLRIVTGAIIVVLLVAIVILNNANSEISKQIKTAGLLPGISYDEGVEIRDAKLNSMTFLGYVPDSVDLTGDPLREVVLHRSLKPDETQNSVERKVDKIMSKNNATVYRGLWNSQVYTCYMNKDGKRFKVVVTVDWRSIECLISDQLD